MNKLLTAQRGKVDPLKVCFTQVFYLYIETIREIKLLHDLRAKDSQR